MLRQLGAKLLQPGARAARPQSLGQTRTKLPLAKRSLATVAVDAIPKVRPSGADEMS